VILGHVTDARAGDESGVIGQSRDGTTGLDYGIVADRPVVPWLERHVRAALREGGLSGAPSSPGGAPRGASELAVRVVRFELGGTRWVKGVGVFDVALHTHDGVRAAQRLVVQTTALATDDDDASWTAEAQRLARWSGVEITRWTHEALAREPE
jgi:hypothetical protein